jgi:hypothetical protein
MLLRFKLEAAQADAAMLAHTLRDACEQLESWPRTQQKLQTLGELNVIELQTAAVRENLTRLIPTAPRAKHPARSRKSR